LVESQNIDYAIRLGIAAGYFFGTRKQVAIGMDTRTTSPMILNAIVSGAASAGCGTVMLGVTPTPVVQYAVREMHLDGGLMVTASHNPPEFNGVKFFSSDGTEFSKSQELSFERIFAGKPERAPWDSLGSATAENVVQQKYRDSVLSHVGGGNRATAIVDCANGAAIGYSPEILAAAGGNVITLNSHPDGRFPGRMPEPLEENVGALMSAVKAHGADIGIAHDGDADRATFTDENGNYISGDISLAILAMDAVERAGKGVVVTPINTSRVVKDVVESRGGKMDFTAIGSPIIARRMMENRAILGGEGNGGVIFPEHQYCRDGMMAAARMLSIAHRRGPLSSIIAELPRYYIKNHKIHITPGTEGRILELVKKNADGKITDIDGIKSTAFDHWSLVRASGTEPLIRITVESDDENLSARIMAEKVKAVGDIIKSLS
jgi:phosphoglucosamine mutase